MPFRPGGVDAGTSGGNGLAIARDDRAKVLELLHFLQVCSADTGGSVGLGVALHVLHSINNPDWLNPVRDQFK